MSKGWEYKLVEKPSIDILKSLGYSYISRQENIDLRAEEGLNNVILKDVFVESLIRINDIGSDIANTIYQELTSITDNEKWISLLRGNYSKTVPGQATKKTIYLIDYLDAENNRFHISNQFKVHAQNNRIPDLVCFVNGIPLVVIEAKSPVNYKTKKGEAFDQIKLYEKEIPRLFYTNLFNIITDGNYLLYGATGSPSDFWGYWTDPWPRDGENFGSELEKGYYSLLSPDRLLDILAHFIVFEKEDGKVIKKICRYQQYRAVNKIFNRINKDPNIALNGIARKDIARKGLIWHTQGSGKSLTMVFLALKLKAHLNYLSDKLSPNLLILTDRIDLDTQISKTFEACGLSNPIHITSRNKLLEKIHSNSNGLTILSTVFKFEGLHKEVKNSKDWILLVDECHRTQEKDLGAYLRKTFPKAWFIGFTGTPIKKTDKDTYKNFSPPNESYLDKYSIDDAVRDGATVPIKYTSRMIKWHVEGINLDILFDQWFANETEQIKAEIKRKGLTQNTVLKHGQRIKVIAKDIWEHFKEHAKKDGYKAQIVACDREAIILYKRALNEVIVDDLIRSGLSEAEAKEQTEGFSVPVYSTNQEDDKPSEDLYIDSIRKDLVKYSLDVSKGWYGRKVEKKGNKPFETEKDVKTAFKKKGQAPWFLIVVNKLLTGFDAPAESVMYLDSPLKEHNLLQAIARTNRIDVDKKPYGLIVDYVGVTKHLAEALATYNKDDVQNVMSDIDDMRSLLHKAHIDVFRVVKKLRSESDYSRKTGSVLQKSVLSSEVASGDISAANAKNCAQFFTPGPQSPGRSRLPAGHAIEKCTSRLVRNRFEQRDTGGFDENTVLLNAIGALDEWLKFKSLARRFIKLYEALTPDPFVLDYKGDLKWIVMFLCLGTQKFEVKDFVDIKDYSEKIRNMLEQELEVTGIKDIVKLRTLTDKDYWDDFNINGKSDEEIERAAIRKASELKKILTEKKKDNMEQYQTFSERLKEILEELKGKQISFADLLKKMQGLSTDIDREGRAYEKSELSKNAYGVYKILDALIENVKRETEKSETDREKKSSEATLNKLQKVALEIDIIYSSEGSAPRGWHLKEQMRKELKSMVRQIVFAAEIPNWKELPSRIEEYALNHYVV